MKIVYCLHGTYNSGGMERIVIDKANWLAQNGVEVIIVTTEQNGRADFFALYPSVKRIDLDILYSHTNGLNVLAKFFARTCRLKQHRERLAQVICKENPDIVISTFGNEVGFVPKIKHRAKRIVEIHFSRWYRLQLNRKGLWRMIDAYLTAKDKRILSKYDRFVCLTEEDRQNWGKVDNLVVIPNFIKQQASVPAKLTQKSMIAVGRLSYQKGYERLLKAWQMVAVRHPDWTLKIYGDGELKGVLEALIVSLGLAHCVEIKKPVSHIESEYLNSSALVLSSRYEGLPMVLLEAAAAGLPLIAFACQCGPKDVIENYKNGILIPEGDVEALADSIIQIIENENLRCKMGQAAYKTAEKFLMPNIMLKWLDLFRQVQVDTTL